MRILHLANHAHNIGNGIVNVMVDLACMQARAGHEVTIASSGGGFEPLLAREGVRHVRLPQAPKPRYVPAMVAGFNRLLAEHDPEVVHAHMMSGALIARFGVLRRRFALVTTVHNEFQKSATLMRVGDRVVGVTEAVAQLMERRGIPAHKLAVVLNGTIGTPRLAETPLPKSPALGRPSIVTVCGMYYRKGIPELLRAFARLSPRFPTAELYLVGDGPDREQFEAMSRELGVDARVHFTGFIADPRGYLAEADVFVLASHREPAGLVLSEAREAGSAIVATRVDGIPEMLDHGEAGVLVPANDDAALAEAIEKLLCDREAREALVARGRRNLEHFHVRRVCDEYQAIYEAACDALHARRRDLQAAGVGRDRVAH
ncbi:glycosyltransferase family 4 protein [Paraburkholderia sp. J67]|uniref:glycosyltransferase family 4 protein n=1 Tax=Paraburkholderia sp. J67 TaxID=2805435 RepID=UPI002ABE4DFB|nr:glycosyltransferase family 4 protein [Paraburkholderia sp. J67]